MNLARISLILNAVLLVAVAFLYYMVLSGPEASGRPPHGPGPEKPHTIAQDSVGPEAPPAFDAQEDHGAIPSSPMTGGQGIYYVNTDSLLEQYTFFKKAKEQLEARSRRFENDMRNRVAALQNEASQAEQRAQSGQLTQTQGQELEQQLMQKQQQLAQYRDEESQKLMDEEQKLNKRLNDDIQKFMKGYGSRRGYRYVLGYATANANILYANDSLDITREVVRGINKK